MVVRTAETWSFHFCRPTPLPLRQPIASHNRTPALQCAGAAFPAAVLVL